MPEREYYCETCFIQSNDLLPEPHSSGFFDGECNGSSVEFDFSRDRRIRAKLLLLRTESQSLLDLRSAKMFELSRIKQLLEVESIEKLENLENEITEVDLAIDKLEKVKIPKLRNKLKSLMPRQVETRDVEDGRKQFEARQVAIDRERREFENALHRILPNEHTKYFKEELGKIKGFDIDELRSKKLPLRPQQTIFCERCLCPINIEGEYPEITVSNHKSHKPDILTGSNDCANAFTLVSESDLIWILYATLADEELRNLKEGHPIDWPRANGRALTLEERRLNEEEQLRQGKERRNGG